MKSKIVILLILGILGVNVLVFIAINALQGLDVIGKGSIASFKIVTEELEDKITSDDNNNRWVLSTPDDTARFTWNKDFSKSLFYDVTLEFSAEPFIESGLDINKLPEDMILNDIIIVGTKLGEEKIIYNEEATPFESYKKIVELKRESIKYHKELEHYGLDLKNGNMFEWAKDMNTNDKDIVIVLEPKPFIEAGADPEKIEGWIYAKISTMIDGEKIEVYKLLKPYNIK